MEPKVTPVARSVPFDNSTNTYTSLNVQDAIEEAQSTAIANDRWNFIAVYGGNALVGRYLEAYPSIDTLVAPVLMPEDSTLVTATLGTIGSAGTFTVGIFKSSDLVTPVTSLTLNMGESNKVFSNINIDISSGESLSVRVTNGSRVSPFARIWISTRTV